MPKKHKTITLPKKILVFNNLDKTKREKWSDTRDMINFPSPKRICISANPDSGKTNLIKNILLRTKPPYKRIYLLHYDPETLEYNDIPEIIRLTEIPNPKDPELFDGLKSALIIDDYEYKYLSKDELKRLDRILGWTSTHRFVDIYVATQDYFNIPTIVRRSSNIHFVWKNSMDVESLVYIGRKYGLNKQQINDLFKTCTSKFDNICFDSTTDTPYKLRKNSYEVLEEPKREDPKRKKIEMAKVEMTKKE